MEQPYTHPAQQPLNTEPGGFEYDDDEDYSILDNPLPEDVDTTGPEGYPAETGVPLAGVMDSEGVDPNRELSDSESATLERLTQLYPGQTFSPSDHVGAEYIDQDGRTYDQMGNPVNSRYWNRDSFISAIDAHLLKSNDFTVIDMTGYTSTQREEISEYIYSLPQDLQDSIITVGF